MASLFAALDRICARIEDRVFAEDVRHEPMARANPNALPAPDSARAVATVKAVVDRRGRMARTERTGDIPALSRAPLVQAASDCVISLARDGAPEIRVGDRLVVVADGEAFEVAVIEPDGAGTRRDYHCRRAKK